MRRIAVLDAPSNLGLRPPTATSVPGCAKAPGALRDHGLLARLAARDAGCLTPPRYDAGDWRPGDGVAHAAQIAAYSRALADRIGEIIDAGEFPVVLGGDCSILLGSGIAMHRLGDAVGGRVGLVFVDGHSDFRHPGNASYVGAAAGEDLALVTGRGQPDLASIEGRRPYFRDVDVVVMGIRAQDEHRLDLQAAGIVTRPVPALRAEGAARSAQWARDQLADCAGYWVHVDVDVLDPAVMPAVDAPSPGGIAFPELELLLAGLVESPHCLGVEITVFDPDYDPDGQYAAEITSAVAAGLAAARTVAARPDLIAARRDMDGTNTRAASGGASAERAGSAGRGAGVRRHSAGSDRVGLGGGGLGGGRDGAGSGGVGLGGGGLGGGRDGAGSGGTGSGGTGLGGTGSGLGGAASRGGVAASGPVAAKDAAEEEWERRRASADAESVSLAAAGMSEGPVGAPEEAAAPATTLLGVEEAGDLPAAASHSAMLADVEAGEPEVEGSPGLGDSVPADSGPEDAAEPSDSEALAGDASPDHDEGEASEDAGAEVSSSDRSDSSYQGASSDLSDDDAPPPRDVAPDLDAAESDRREGAEAADRGDHDHDDDQAAAAERGVEAGHGDGAEPENIDQGDARAENVARGGAELEDVARGGAELEDVARGGAESEKLARGGAESENIARGRAEPETTERGGAEPEDAERGGAEAGSVGPGNGQRGAGAGRRGRGNVAARNGSDARVRLLSRPLGSAPLLDSEPLPATRPGLLRPRTAQPRPAEPESAETPEPETRGDQGQGGGEPRTPEGFSLPAQRPAFDVGSGEPADIA